MLQIFFFPFIEVLLEKRMEIKLAGDKTSSLMQNRYCPQSFMKHEKRALTINFKIIKWLTS